MTEASAGAVHRTASALLRDVVSLGQHCRADPLGSERCSPEEQTRRRGRPSRWPRGVSLERAAQLNRSRVGAAGTCRALAYGEPTLGVARSLAADNSSAAKPSVHVRSRRILARPPTALTAMVRWPPRVPSRAVAIVCPSTSSSATEPSTRIRRRRSRLEVGGKIAALCALRPATVTMPRLATDSRRSQGRNPMCSWGSSSSPSSRSTTTSNASPTSISACTSNRWPKEPSRQGGRFPARRYGLARASFCRNAVTSCASASATSPPSVIETTRGKVMDPAQSRLEELCGGSSGTQPSNSCRPSGARIVAGA